MGYLARGTWVDQWYDTASSGGRFVRQDSRFRSWIGQDRDYPPEAGRYHLYVSWACPWAHRTLIYRALKGLKDVITVTVVDPLMLSNGWVIAPDADPVNHALGHLGHIKKNAVVDFTANNQRFDPCQDSGNSLVIGARDNRRWS